MRQMTGDHKAVFSTLPDLLEFPDRSEPGKPVHGDLLDVLVDHLEGLGCAYPGTVWVSWICHVAFAGADLVLGKT